MGFRTDLAMEAVELVKGHDIGIKQEKEIIEDLEVTKITIETDEAAKKLGKLKGKYITISFPPLTDNYENIEDKIKVISKQIRYLLPREGLAFVVGLGNETITPDALGPKTIKSVLATRHITGEIARSTGLEGLRPVAKIAPGVLGQTGMEVSEVIEGIMKKIDPSVIIIIDALASKESKRLGTTIQISNTGISPGSGIGNARPGINEETMGIPVISLGVPTVVDAQTMAYDILKTINNSNQPVIKEKTAPRGEPMMVTPREIDLLISRASQIIAMSINGALQPGFSLEDIMALV